MNTDVEPIRARTVRFSVDLIGFCETLKPTPIDYFLRSQILRAGTSIGANVVEGYASSSRKQLIYYYEIALRSADETKYWLELIKSAYDISIPHNLSDELDQLCKILTTITKKLKSNSKSNQETDSKEKAETH